MTFKENIIEFRGMPLFQAGLPYNGQVEMNDFACFFYIVQGNYQIVERTGIYQVGEKEALVKQCGRYISRIFEEEQEVCQAIAIFLYPDLLREIYKNEYPAFLKERKQNRPPSTIVSNELIEQFIQTLFFYFENPALVDEQLAILKIKELILILMKSERADSVQQFFSELFAPRNMEFEQIIENHIFSDVSIAELAFICKKSLSSFKRTFKKIFNQTPAKYIKNRRLEHAASLLLLSDDSITGVAFDSGFNDLATFSSAFYKKYQMSPSQYRLNHKTKRLT